MDLLTNPSLPWSIIGSITGWGIVVLMLGNAIVYLASELPKFFKK